MQGQTDVGGHTAGSVDKAISAGPVGRPLWEHQRLAISKAKDGRHALGLFFEVGTGKTRSVIEILKWHHSEGRGRFLIFCPPAVLSNWKKEILQWTDIPEESIHILYGSGKERAKAIDDLVDKKNYIVVTNYESLVMPSVFSKLFQISSNVDVLVADESHKLKNHQAKRTKNAIQISKNIAFKYLLSGTPVLNTPMDLFSQYKVMFGGFPVRGKVYDVFFAFRNIFFYDANASIPKDRYFPNWKLKPGAMDEINETVKETSIHVKKKDCLDLPPFIKVRREVELSDDQTKAYKEMKTDLITYLGSDACVAEFAMTKALRLMQITSGFITTENGETHKFRATPREKLLLEVLEDLTPDHKVIVWCVFKENYKMVMNICKELGVKFAELHGGIPSHLKGNQIDYFNNHKECRVLIANPLAGGVGVNLLSSDYSIYYSRDFSLEGDIQSEARNYRAGSEIHEKITRIDIVTPGTIDELVLERLSQKEKIGKAILEDLKNYGN